MKRTLRIVFGLLIFVLVLPFMVRYSLEEKVILFGWIGFIRRNFPKAIIEPAGVATGVVFLILLVGFIEIFARSILRSITSGTNAPPRRWRFRWTLSMVAALFLMFAVGYSTIGLARHIGWMINSPGQDYQVKSEPSGQGFKKQSSDAWLRFATRSGGAGFESSNEIVTFGCDHLEKL
jgi:hypothetical protein